MASGKRREKLMTRGIFEGWIGFSGGKPHFFKSTDSYGDMRSCDTFKNRKDALGRYQDVRKVRIEWEMERKTK